MNDGGDVLRCVFSQIPCYRSPTYQGWSEHRAEGSLLLRDFTSRSRLWFVVCYEISSIRRLRGILVNFIYLSHPKGRDKLNKLKQLSLISSIANSVHLWSVYLQTVTIHSIVLWHGNRSLDFYLTKSGRATALKSCKSRVNHHHHAVRERAKRAEPLVSLHSLRTINPPIRPEGIDPPMGEVLAASSM